MMLPYLLGIALFCFVLERVAPGWPLPKVKTWPFRVIAVNLVQLGVVLLAGLSWERWLVGFSISSTTVCFPFGRRMSYFIATFIFYWWHRWRHRVDRLWLFHQIHHSPQRIEVCFSFAPTSLEMIVNSLIGSVLVYSVLGLSLKGGAIYTFCTAVGEFFYHTNVRTPQWVGYIFQRPEMHRIHHEYARHQNNYGDIVWWDMMFQGLMRTPRSSRLHAGSMMRRNRASIPMPQFKDVHK